MCCLKNVSDDYFIYDDISFDDEIETIEEDKKIETINWESCADNFKEVNDNIDDLSNKINEIIDYINKEK